MSTTVQEKVTAQNFRSTKKSFRTNSVLSALEGALMRARAVMKDDFRKIEVVQQIQAFLSTNPEAMKIQVVGTCDEFNNFWRNCTLKVMDDEMDWIEVPDREVPSELSKLMKSLNSVTRDMPIFSTDAEIEITEAFADVNYGELRGRTSYHPDFLTFVANMVKTGEEDEDD